mmetsp:Transcript_41290/g.64521  ORF Transcript_41290/g.64521 Transcript_41290/m.64521 type:complete len:417 (-) Transcript_41290:139-1389(-)
MANMDKIREDIGFDSDEEEDSIRDIPSPETKPSHYGSLQPKMVGGKKTMGGSKKFMSMVDLAGAIESDSGASTPTSQGSAQDFQGPVMQQTVGTVYKPMKRSVSNLDFMQESQGMGAVPPMMATKRCAEDLLVVFDMDHTMVGDLVSLSDRDNIETNVPWVYWPEGKDHGLSPNFILPFLMRGMIRPGLLEYIKTLLTIGATIVVYTHSEERWASKVCAAMEKLAGCHFIKRIFSRMDCKDGHPDFTARKSLDFVCQEMRSDGYGWVELEKTVMFDDDGNAVNKAEQSRLVKVASYDYWEPCQWDEVVNEEMMARNPPDMGDMVRRSVVEWGIAPPSYIKVGKLTNEDSKRDARWAAQLQQKRQILLSYNKVARLDRVMYDLDEVFRGDMTNLESIPERSRTLLGKSVQPQSRRRT